MLISPCDRRIVSQRAFTFFHFILAFPPACLEDSRLRTTAPAPQVTGVTIVLLVLGAVINTIATVASIQEDSRELRFRLSRPGA